MPHPPIYDGEPEYRARIRERLEVRYPLATGIALTVIVSAALVLAIGFVAGLVSEVLWGLGVRP